MNTRNLFRMTRPLIAYIVCAFLVTGVARAQDSSLPFTISVTIIHLDSLPDYVTERSPDEWMDFPVSTAMVNGNFWVMFKNGETKPAFRYMGTNFENAKRQKDGTFYAPVSRPYILGGMWYDSADKKLYAPLHCETKGYYTTILRQIHLASSMDMGLTWKYEGPILTRDDPKLPLPAGPETSGLYWDGGEGDFFIYVDNKGGYVYLYANSYTWPKPGVKAPYFFRHHVARCKISDKMAPGKWQKFYNGTWSQPGLGGKASEVNAYYVMYNSYLGKYLSFNYDNSISTCTDLNKQDWTPCFKIKGDYWGGVESFAWLVTNADKTDTYSAGKTLYLYSYWQKSFLGLYKIELGKGNTTNSEGYVVGYAKQSQVSANPSKLYLEGLLYESPDPLESRHRRRIYPLSNEITYSAGWKDELNDTYNGGDAKTNGAAGSTLQFSFRAKDIFWRAVNCPDCGKADVYLDNRLAKTVDCWASPASPLQFAFSREGLDSNVIHTIKIVVRGDKNEKSSGTRIKSLLFEYTADSYQASDGFSSIMGKNNWYYQQKIGRMYTNMIFKDTEWTGKGGSKIDYFHMTSGNGEAVRKWIAPHSGRIQIEGTIEIDKDSTGEVSFEIKKNNKRCWISRELVFEKPASPVITRVRKGDCVYFIVKKKSKQGSGKVTWDPAVTYE